MKFNCVSCGTTIVAYKGNHKYCACCRAEIEELAASSRYSFKRCGEIVCDRHKQERYEEQLREALNRNKKTIDYVVALTKKTGLSYGRQVAVLEGRV